MIYFDNSATTKPYEEVIKVMAESMEIAWANPSSAHKLGHEAFMRLKDYRERVAKLLNCDSNEVVFTSGGTEGNNYCIKGVAKSDNHIITTSIEHPSVKATIEHLKSIGCEVTVLKVNDKGLIDIETLKAAIKKNTVLVSIMHMNNEVGVLQDLKGIGVYLKENHERIKFHVDAVQSFGKHKIDVKNMRVDLLTTSAHKHHGPRGIGVAYVRKGLVLEKLIHGSGQESGARAGTENLHNIAGLVVSAEIMHKNMECNYKTVSEIKEYCIERLGEIPDIRINSPLNEAFSPYVLNISVIGAPSEVLVRVLADKDICISKGSACSSKSESASHVLSSLGLSFEEVKSAVRISFCETNTKEEVECTVEKIKEAVKFLRRVKL